MCSFSLRLPIFVPKWEMCPISSDSNKCSGSDCCGTDSRPFLLCFAVGQFKSSVWLAQFYRITSAITLHRTRWRLPRLSPTKVVPLLLIMNFSQKNLKHQGPIYKPVAWSLRKGLPHNSVDLSYLWKGSAFRIDGQIHALKSCSVLLWMKRIYFHTLTYRCPAPVSVFLRSVCIYCILILWCPRKVDNSVIIL